MIVPHVLEALVSLGGFGGLAALGTVLVDGRRAAAQAARLEAQFEPDHGDSMRDAIDRIEERQAQQGEDLRDLRAFVGHEIGEIRRSADREHQDHAERIRALEQATR